jgi:hypothetical protein
MAAILALLAAVSIWLSAGVVLDDGPERIAALPSLQWLVVLVIAVPAVAWLAKLRLEHAWPLAISLLLWLPFVGASAMWEGPIEGIVWLLVIAGLVAARPPTLPSACSHPSVAPWLAALLMALTSAVVFGQVRNVIPGGDEPHYLAATQSLLHDADLKVANNYENGDYLEYFPGRLEPHFLKRSTGGDIYSIHAPGVSVIVLPAFAVAGYAGAVWMMIVVAALSVALMWQLAFTVSGSIAAAWAGVAGVSLSAPYFFHTFTIYPEIIGGLCVLLGAWLLVDLAAGRDPHTPALVAVGAALALLPWLHTRFAVLAGIVGLVIVARLATRTAPAAKIVAFLAVPIALGIAWFGFFYVVWGSPNPAVAYGADTSTSFGYVPRGGIGLLFDQQFGVFTTAPIYAIALAGAFMLFKAQPRLAIELALIVIPYTVTVASYAMWWGGSAAPGRFLVSILPLAALPLALAWSRSTVLRVAALVLTVASAALILPRAFEDGGRFIYNNRSGVDATVQWLSANYNLPASAPSVHGGGGSAALRAGLIWLAAFGIATGVAARVTRRQSMGARVAITSVLLALAAMIAAALVTPAGLELRRDRQLAVLERIRPSWHPTVLDLAAGSATTMDSLLQRLHTTMAGPAPVLNRVPAGDYVIVGESGGAGGSMKISLGRNDLPIAQPSLDDLQNSQAPYRLRLPVMARNLRIETGVRDAVYELRPVGLVPSASRHPATRAARFGAVRAFFFDDWAYPERDGFWTRAEGEATVVIDDDPARALSGLSISVTAGAVPTTVELSSGSWRESLSLESGEKRDVTLPPAEQGSWTVRIRSGAGFRPSEREPGNPDVRKLAAWIAVH